MLAACAAWLGLASVSVAPNRIVPGTAYLAAEAVGWPLALAGCLPMLAVAGLAWRPDERSLRLSLAVVLGLMMWLPLWLAINAMLLIDPDMPQSRLGIGPAVWLLLFLLALALIELRTRLALSRLAGWGLVVPILVTWALCLAWWLAPLALVREYQARSAQFLAAIGHHLALVGAAVGASLVLGVALALAMRRHERLERLGFGVLNFLQTIPSLALFGLLLAPLAWLSANQPWLAALGVSGIGWAPALLALIAYSLLPMVRNTFVALEGVDPGVIEAARGMGMSRSQVFLQVRLPLALPVLLEGVRITTVQAIGLAAVAALIGAGGLGTFIFQGLGQAAMDMVLLGALPILAMALIADALLGALASRLRDGSLTSPGGAR
ncbi:ABC transporter permease [Halomonas urumqiensis]|uniref:ABC transporter permease n=1 Tax=Halomonas urumqiensis TaxID=1684789 RepID=A0A2N7ULV2_9GAMM|nr:ABC transporter permease [Halomonas urumqiensis]PMR81420.1 ABC transporter permease [Halomonas urumqiensis]PTB01221.1 ABC transporter permease [Halomonas urumqiensis]